MSERICVCGLGKVGKPILDTLRLKGFQAVGYDCVPKLSEVSLSDAVEKSDAAIFIVPTPSRADGSFSNDHLLAALLGFKGSIPMLKKKDYLYIISSTTMPGSCDAFVDIVGPNLVYKPEFIRLEHVNDDLLNPKLSLFGGNSLEIICRASFLLAPMCSPNIHSMTLLEAELAKITLNCALTMKISLANQLHLVAKKIGADSEKIMEAVGSDPRIGHEYLKPGWPYGGACLPRDNRMFQFVAERVGVKAHLSEAADKINQLLSDQCDNQ